MSRESPCRLSNGDGTFQAPQVIQTYSSTTAPVNLPPAVVQFGDATGNGKLDLFTESGALDTSTGMYAYSVQLYLGNGDGTFGSALTAPLADNFNPPPSGEELGQIVLADMNGDGKPDLVSLGTANNGDSELAIALGNGDGTFRTPTLLDFAGGETVGYGLAVADFNGDGKPDVAVTGSNPPYDTGIFLGNGDGTVQTFTPSGGTAQPSEGINLFVFGPALAVKLNGGTGLPDLIAGGAVLINQASSAPTLIATSTALAATATSITAGQSVTFTATITASSTPSGTVTFYDGTNALGTGTLNGSGVATYSTSSLSVGSHSITATYPGNSTFAASTSQAITVIVTAVPASFTIGASPSSGSVTAGSSAQTTITVTPMNGFNQQVSFACSGLPTGGSCSFSPQNVTPNGSAVSTTLTIGTTTQSAALAPAGHGHSRRGSQGVAMLAFLAGGVLWLLRRRKASRWLHSLPVIAGLLGMAALISACNGGGGSGSSSTQPQSATYMITVTATAGTEIQTATYSLTVAQ